MERKISSKPVDVSRLSPMMRQYWKVKEQYLEQLLFFRLGDFYELFFDDALIASRELELTLTGKECGLDERAPMCGIPYHSCENYIARLVKKGYKVAICEQMEDPATAKGLRLVPCWKAICSMQAAIITCVLSFVILSRSVLA